MKNLPKLGVFFAVLLFLLFLLPQAAISSEAANPSWVKVKDLQAGDWLKTQDGWVEIESIEYVQEPTSVYNLSVSAPNTFWANGILAHNKDCGPCDGIEYILNPGSPQGHQDLVVNMNRDNANPCICDNWDNVGMLHNGSPANFSTCYADGSHCLTGYHSHINDIGYGDHELQFTVNNDTCLCNTHSFTVPSAYINGRVYSDEGSLLYWRSGSCAGCNNCHLASSMNISCSAGADSGNVGWGCNSGGAFYNSQNNNLYFAPGLSATCTLTGLPSGYECAGGGSSCVYVFPNLASGVNGHWFQIEPIATPTNTPTPTPTPIPTCYGDWGDRQSTDNSAFSCACSYEVSIPGVGSAYFGAKDEESQCNDGGEWFSNGNDEGIRFNAASIQGQTFETGQIYQWEVYHPSTDSNNRVDYRVWADWDGSGGNPPVSLTHQEGIRQPNGSDFFNVQIPSYAGDANGYAFIRARVVDSDYDLNWGDYNLTDTPGGTLNSPRGEIEDYRINITITPTPTLTPTPTTTGGPSPTPTVEPCGCDEAVLSPSILTLRKDQTGTIMVSYLVTSGTYNPPLGEIDHVDYNDDPSGVVSLGPVGSPDYYPVEVTGLISGQGATITADIYLDCNPEVVSCQGTTSVSVLSPGPWFQTKGGDLHADNSIVNPIPANPDNGPYCSLPGASGFPGVLSYGGDLDLGDGEASQTFNWQADTDSSLPRESYSYFASRIPSPTPLSSVSGWEDNPENPTEGLLNQLPGGFYIMDTPAGNLNLPTGSWSIKGKSILILVPGNLNSQIRINVGTGDFLAIITQGNVAVNVNDAGANPAMEGVFIADGGFSISSGGDILDADFTARGMFSAGSFNLARDKGETNEIEPAEYFEYRPDLWLNSPMDTWSPTITWQEVAP